MGASSSDDDDESQPSDDVDESRSFVTMDSSASDIICLFEAGSTFGSSFGSSSSVRSYGTWTKNNDSNMGPGFLESAGAAGAALTAAGAASLPSFQSGRRSCGGGDVSPLSMRTISLLGSEGLCGSPSPSAPGVQQCSSGSSAGGNNGGGDDDNCVDHHVLMAALRGAGIHTGPAAGFRGNLEHSYLASMEQDANELILRGREGETLSTLSVDAAQHAQEQRGGEEQEEEEEEEEEEDYWNLVDGFSTGSMPQLVEQTDPALAEERTEELVKILCGGPDLRTAVSDIHIARFCELDLSMSDTNGDLTRTEVIGAGSYGRVSQVRHEPSGVVMALKELTEVRKGLRYSPQRTATVGVFGCRNSAFRGWAFHGMCERTRNTASWSRERRVMRFSSTSPPTPCALAATPGGFWQAPGHRGQRDRYFFVVSSTVFHHVPPCMLYIALFTPGWPSSMHGRCRGWDAFVEPTRCVEVHMR